MVKLLKRKECEDCTTQAEVEALDSIVDQLRDILMPPEGKDLIHHAKDIMKRLEELDI